MTNVFLWVAIVSIATLIFSSFVSKGYGFYEIAKGKNFSTPFRAILNLGSKSLKYRVLFDKSCRYEMQKSAQIAGNKLFGTSTNFSLHHRNSIRFIWRYLVKDDRMQIGYSYYDKNKRTIAYFSFELSLETFYELEIRKGKDCLDFYVDDILIGSVPSKHLMFGYRLWPYFGGTAPAPQTITISLQKPRH